MPYYKSSNVSAAGRAKGYANIVTKLSAVAVALALSAPAFAVNENVADAIDQADTTPSPWSGYLGLQAASNAYKRSEPSSYQAVALNGRIGYSDDWGSVRLSLGGEVETHHNQSYYYDALLEYRTPYYKISDDWSYVVSGGVFLPTSHTSRKNKLYAAPRLAGYLFYRPSNSLSFYFSPRYRYNFYKYETGRYGERFTQHQVDLLGDGTWQFAKNWYLDINGSYRMAKEYNTGRTKKVFTVGEEIGWSFAPSWTVAVGHNNSGQLYNPEVGPSKGFEFFDERSSVFYVSLTKYL
ncbi:hypothetical protein [Paraferrimonas haliotis]|uniref:Uncharacterized protein n=1 Tax=Paraferrimonas haliotis TaxID=2013866 RepID=A0AA37TNI4_9GAMM|nr:hypothetical protein [Paraferrimonas haliotis]GLS82695.1 hypothetical protein GCM10007894_06720 [Paraferrimonas haliotis]